MNPRIRELAIQSGAGEWGDSIVPAMMDIEKFAELIVGECIDIIEKLPPGYKDYRDQIEDAFARACVTEIKQQLGVHD